MPGGAAPNAAPKLVELSLAYLRVKPLSLNLSERLAIFIDGPDLQRTAKALTLDIDYKRLLMLFRQRGHLVRSHYYAALSPSRSDCTLRPLLDWLSYNGYVVVTKTAADFATSGGRHALAVEISVDAMQLAGSIDHFVLFSGCATFVRLVEGLQQQGRKVSVISSLRAGAVADEMRRKADHFLELDELRPILSREPRTTISDNVVRLQLP